MQGGVNADAISHEDYLNAPGETYSVKFDTQLSFDTSKKLLAEREKSHGEAITKLLANRSVDSLQAASGTISQTNDVTYRIKTYTRALFSQELQPLEDGILHLESARGDLEMVLGRLAPNYMSRFSQPKP